MSEPKAGAVRRAAITCRAFVPCGDVPGDIDNDITLTLPSQRRMILKDSEMEMRERMDLLKTAVDNDAVDNGSPPEILFFARTSTCYGGRCLVIHLHATKPEAVLLHSGAKVVRAKATSERSRLPWSAAESCCDRNWMMTTFLSPGSPGKGRRRR